MGNGHALLADSPPLNRFQAWVVAQVAAGRRTIGVTGGWGCGKTYEIAVLMQLLAESRPTEDGLIVYPRASQAAVALGALAESVLGDWGWVFRPTFQGAPAPHWVSPAGPRVWVKSYFRPGTVGVAANTLEGINAGWSLMDEVQTYGTSEAAEMAMGRTRAGSRPLLVLFGRPSLYEWWPEWVNQRNGATIRVSSTVNRANIPDFDGWVSQMTQVEIDERIHCRPVAPEGAVYGMWRVEEYPAGNLTPRGWKYRPEFRGRIAIDWGRRHPSALLLAEATDLGPDTDVIVGELNPEGVSTYQLARLVNRVALVRSAGLEPGKFVLDCGVGDKAGRAKNDQTLKSNFDVLAAPPGDEGGIGIRLTHRYASDPNKVSVVNGIARTKERVFHEHHGRRLLITPEAWAASVSADGVSFARALQSYVYPPGSDVPKKDGAEHPLDALRYDTVEFRWGGTNVALPSGTAAPSRAPRQGAPRPPVGGAR